MTSQVSSEIDALEEQYQHHPGSESVLEDLLLAYASEEFFQHPRRIEHIVDYVTRFPRGPSARTPLAHFSPELAPQGWTRLEQVWLRHQAEHPADAEIARGFALFLAESDPLRALEVLRAMEAAANPNDAALYTDMGRICQDPVERLKLFLRARDLGSSQPNLLVWIATAALDANDLAQAERAGTELLSLVDQSTLVSSIANHANRKHWGHTVCGVLAARRGETAVALEHLEQSAAVRGDYRLSSYGPSFRLARELARLGEWDAIVAYLEACRAFWDEPALQSWTAQAKLRQLPEFPAH